VRMWAGFMWLRTDSCECGNKASGFINGGEFL